LAAPLLQVKAERQTMISTMKTTPYWMESASMPRLPKLDRDMRADVVVVGGGITGLTAAYRLVKAGRSVVLLERERCAQIDTGHTSAHLTMVTDLDLSELSRTFGSNHAQAVWDAGLAAIAQIDAIVRDEDIPCEFMWVPGYKHNAIGSTATSAEAFKKEAALATELGFDATFVGDVPYVGGAGIRFDDQARFHPRQYLAGVARAIVASGGEIYEHSAAEEFCDSPRSVKANGCTISCEAIVLATHTPLMGNTTLASATLFQTKLALYSSYVVAGRVASGKVPDALFWDTASPYHYLRIEPHRGFDVVIFGGEDHKTGQASNTNACYDRLERTVSTLVPGVEITHRWSGQVIETPNGLPYIGETADRQFVATGFSGNGMTFGTLGGMMAADFVLSRGNPWSELLDPGRKKIRGALWDYVAENKDYPYYLARDRFAGVQGKSLRALRRGQGGILEVNGKRVAAYRDPAGETFVKSPTCTHMGCEVAWNDAERTWDCPCHGSRFKPNGAVIAGPAESPLPDPGE
jgi:glycine/D-amino acid oxidase-like deaminating enzyme/nitrite reductase/ring-hydroxylating ferredoxin subunit